MTGRGADEAGTASQERWRAVRLFLKGNRHRLATDVGTLYPDAARVAGTGLLCRPEWVPSEPVELDRVRLDWDEAVPVPTITGTGAESVAVRPVAAGGGRFAAYADAVGALDRPVLFENRPVYRLLGVDLADPGAARLDFTDGRYFDTISVSEAVAHEFAAAARDGRRVGLDQLSLRAAISDPCDLARRPASAAVTTLTFAADRAG